MTNPPESPRRYRVIQWCTGNIGTRTLACILDHPRLELAGVFVTSPAKAGRDASELLPPTTPQEERRAPTGTKATTSAAEVLALEADCVVYVPQGFDLDQVCAILASGKNVVTAAAELIHPAALGADARAQIDAACACGTSVFCTGSSPGVFPQQLPLPLLAMQGRLPRRLTCTETADLSTRDSPEMLFGIMGFGREAPPHAEGGTGGEVPMLLEMRRAPARGSFAVLAKTLGMPLDGDGDGDLAVEQAYGLARRDVEMAAGTVRKGTVAAVRFSVTGSCGGGRTVLRHRALWFVTADVDTGDDDEVWDFGGEVGAPAGNARAGVLVEVEGDTPMSLRVSFPPMSDAEYAAFTPGMTAHPVVNAIPAVCEARAGILTFLDLPPIVPTLE